MFRESNALISIVLFLLSLYNICVLEIGDWVAKKLAMTGCIYYSCVIILWAILFVGVVIILMDIRLKRKEAI